MRSWKYHLLIVFQALLFLTEGGSSCAANRVSHFGNYLFNPKGMDISKATSYNSQTGCYTQNNTGSITKLKIEPTLNTLTMTLYNTSHCTEPYSTTKVIHSIARQNNIQTNTYNGLLQLFENHMVTATQYTSRLNRHHIVCHSASCSQDMADYFNQFGLLIPACLFTQADFTPDVAVDVYSCMSGVFDLQISNGLATFNPYTSLFYSIFYYDESNGRYYEGSNHAESTDNQGDLVFDGTSSKERHKYIENSRWYEKL